MNPIVNNIIEYLENKEQTFIVKHTYWNNSEHTIKAKNKNEAVYKLCCFSTFMHTTDFVIQFGYNNPLSNQQISILKKFIKINNLHTVGICNDSGWRYCTRKHHHIFIINDENAIQEILVDQTKFKYFVDFLLNNKVVE